MMFRKRDERHELMELHYELTSEDYSKVERFIARNIKITLKKTQFRYFTHLIVFVWAVLFWIPAFMFLLTHEIATDLFLIYLFLVPVGIVYLSSRMQRIYREKLRRQETFYQGNWTCRLTETHIIFEHALQEIRIALDAIQEASQLPEFLLLYLAHDQTHFIPRRAFQDQETYDKFGERIRMVIRVDA